MHQQASVNQPAHLVKFKGQGFPCPLSISLEFSSQQLIKVTVEESKSDFVLLFSEKHPEHQAIVEWFNKFFQGIATPFPLALKSKLGPFTWSVLLEVQKIPTGQTVSYQEIAAKLENPRAARAVGNACHVNPFPLIIPCHRVIKSSGHLGGFGFGCNLKQMLLDLESTQ